MAITNNRKGAIKKLKLLTYNSKTTVDSFREKLDQEYKVLFLPNNVECTEYKYGNIKCDVLAPEIYSSNRIILYIHGGCFTGGSRLAYRNFCSSLASKTFSRVVIPEYRLAPAYPFPAAIDDIQSVYKSLYTEESITCSLNSSVGQDIKPEIIIAADGSAASIACSLVFTLTGKFKESIKELILFSPWLDLSPSSRILSAKKSIDEVMSADVIRQSTSDYTYASNTSNATVSPLLATDEQLQDFPNVIIQMGEKEILLEDAKAFKERLANLDKLCILDVWPKMMYMFQMADEYLHESHLALDKIGKLVTELDNNDEGIQFVNQPKLEHSLNSEA